MSISERVFAILTESAASKSKAVTKSECNEMCDSFQDTLSGHSFDTTIGDLKDFTLTVDAVPVCKKECGANCEAYLIDARILDIYMEDNGITDDAEAVRNICEANGIDIKDVAVVIESDETNKSLIDYSKKNVNIGLLKRCSDQINCLINASIRICKKS